MIVGCTRRLSTAADTDPGGCPPRPGGPHQSVKRNTQVPFGSVTPWNAGEMSVFAPVFGAEERYVPGGTVAAAAASQNVGVDGASSLNA